MLRGDWMGRAAWYFHHPALIEGFRMALIDPSERTILIVRLRSVGTANLAAIYVIATGEDPLWVLNNPAAVAAARIVGAIGSDGPSLLIVLQELVQMFPNAPENADLLRISGRLQAQAAAAAAAPDPTQELWIGSEPMVNRAQLRYMLRNILGGHNFSVVYVAGGNQSGRSHSFQLIRHVARLRNIPVHKIDFGVPVEARTLGHLCNQLQKAYGLNAVNEPTHEGATPGDVAVKFARQLCSQLSQMHAPHPKPWIVIDFSDEVPDPAVPEFLRMFCAARDTSEFDNCVVFVLGSTTHSDALRVDLFNMEVEELGDIYEQEIHETASAANQRGGQPLTPNDLQARTADIFNSLQTLPTNARMPELRRALVRLRREVQAP